MARNDFGHWREDYFELNAPESLLTDNAMLMLSAMNKGVRMERTPAGLLICMPPNLRSFSPDASWYLGPAAWMLP